jgi:hypothetical protein
MEPPIIISYWTLQTSKLISSVLFSKQRISGLGKYFSKIRSLSNILPSWSTMATSRPVHTFCRFAFSVYQWCYNSASSFWFDRLYIKLQYLTLWFLCKMVYHYQLDGCQL